MEKAWTFKKELISYYDELSRSYDELYGEEQKRKYSVILKLLKHQKVHKALDFGCGTGLLLEALRDYGMSLLVGIDVSRGMLTEAREKVLDEVDLILCDGELLPIRDEVFDVVFMVTVFQNLYNKKLGLRHVIRVTKKRGLLFLSVPNRGIYPNELLNYVVSEDGVVLANIIPGDKDLIVILKRIESTLKFDYLYKAISLTDEQRVKSISS